MTMLFYGHRFRALCSAASILVAIGAAEARSARPAMQVADMIETARLQTGDALPVAADVKGARQRIGEGVAMSPRYKRFVSFVVRASLAEDRVFVDVITARLDSLASASDVRKVATFSSRFRGNTDLLVAYERMFQWVGDDAIALRWEDDRQKPQVFRVDLNSGKTDQLSRDPAGVAFFGLNEQGVLAYSTKIVPSPGAGNELETGGFVRSGDAYALAAGRIGKGSLLGDAWNRKWYLKRPDEEAAALDISGQGLELDQARFISFSPDGRWLLILGTPPEIPSSWDAYTDDYVRIFVRDERLNPRRGALAIQLKQLYLVDLRSGGSRPILRAPQSFWPKASWAHDSSGVAFGPASLPQPTDNEGLSGKAMVEIDIPSGEIRRIPVDEALVKSGRLDALHWTERDQLVMASSDVRSAAIKRGDDWVVAIPSAVQAGAPKIEVELRQSDNDPPQLYAVDRVTGAQRLVFDPNPGLARRFTLGHVEPLSWTAPDSRQWHGKLYYPASYRKGRTYPLVIQTHGQAANGEFSLNGLGGWRPALGVGVSVYAAQPLAGKDIMVLQMEDQSFTSGPQEAEAYMQAYDAAVDQLAESGLVDPKRVGLQGYSRTGWHVLYALTHSDREYAAAIVSDNIDAGYMQGTLSPGYYEHEIGKLPFGEGMKAWLENSPTFAVDRVRTPLRVQADGVTEPAGLLGPWEFFSRLRQLGRPVEYHVVPDVTKGSHALQNPAQAYASQQGAVDWFDFWLNGHEPDLGDDQGRAEELRAMRKAQERLSKHPRPPLLEWSALPRNGR